MAVSSQRKNDGPNVGVFADLTKKWGDGVPNETGEVRYYCPFCELVRGSPDTKGKFYYNVKRNEGKCFRCDSVVKDEPPLELDSEIDSILRQMGEADEVEAEPDFRDRIYTLKDWTHQVYQDFDALEYLERRSIYRGQINRFRLRACLKPVHGVVIPNRDLGDLKTDYFQVRDMDEEALMKYRNPSRSIKPLYGVDFLHGCRDAFVCEGVFSAISATRYSDQFSALCTYGKTVKDVHVPIFSELPVDRYWLAYDGGEFWALLKGARQLYRSGKAVRIVFLPFETDPNDLSEAELKKAVDSHSLKYNDVSHQFLIWASKQFDLRDADGWEDLQREVVCVKKEVSGEFHP